MDKIPIEDEFHDILRKAMTGLRLTEQELSVRSGVSMESVRQLLSGGLDETSLPLVSKALDLEPNAMVRSAMGLLDPRVSPPEGLELFNSPYHSGMTVNAFLLWDPESLQGALFDTGTDSFPLLDRIEEKGLTITDLFLTHTHPDHIAEVESFTRRLGIPVRSHEREPFEGSITFKDSDEFRVGSLNVRPHSTWGHSKGGTTLVIEGLTEPVAVVGDALFAGSMGGGMVSYEAALRTNREVIFELPDHTVLCPGHGPLTTVRLEKRNNPFFSAEFVS